MAKNSQLSSIYEGCKPRSEILEGALRLEAFAANLSMVAQDEGPNIYKDPETFFANTYPTEGLKTTIREVFGRLTGSREGSPVIKLETGLGGGKTHTLIALYHIARHGSTIKNIGELLDELQVEPMSVAALVGTELAVGGSMPPKTLWGEMAQQLRGDEGYAILKASDESMTSPGERVLRELFGDENCLILLDELAQYLTKASATPIPESGSNLGKQTAAFLQELTQVAASMDNVELVLTALDEKSVYEDETKNIRDVLEAALEEEEIRKNVQDTKEILTRIVRTLEPTKGEEFAHIIRHRLFEDIDASVREKVVEAYLDGYRSDGVKEFLPSETQDPEYREVMIKSYPFHPEVIDILRTKTSSIENFNKTRGVLRLLSVLLKNTWDNRDEYAPSLIHPYHFDFYDDTIRAELIHRLDMVELMPAIGEDLANEDKETRAEVVDKMFKEPYGSRVTTTVLLHSLTQKLKADIHKGANSAEVHLAMWKPGLDPETVNAVLEHLDETWFYFGPEGQYYVAGLNPRLTKIIDDTKEQIGQTSVNQEVEDWIRKVFHAKKFFKPVFFPSSPSDVNDDTKQQTKLAVMHYTDCRLEHGSQRIPDLVRKIFEETGSQGKPRSFINNLVFLVPDTDRVKQMQAQARQYLALRQLIQEYEGGASYLSALTKGQRQDLRQKRDETELYLKVAVIIAYKHVIVPTPQASLSQASSQRPLRVISMRDTERDIENRLQEGETAEESLASFLRDREVARTMDDKPLSPERILDGLWRKTAEQLDGDEFKKLFYKNPLAGIHFSDELIRKSMKKGIQEGKWYAVAADNFYDEENWQSFNPTFTTDTIIILADSEAGKEKHDQYYCSTCGKRKTECICDKQPKAPEETCPKCGRKKSECICGPKPISTFEKKGLTMERIGSNLQAWIDDEDIQKIRVARFGALSRTALSALAKALKQFRTDYEVIFDIKGEMTRPEEEMEFELRYRGGEEGFRKLKSAIFDFKPQDEFDFSELWIHIIFLEGYAAEKFVQDINERVAEFTTGSSYDIEVEPVEEG